MFFDFSPVAAKGLHSDQPSYQVQWTKLQNFMFRRGHLISRPGTTNIVARPLSTVEGSIPQVIAEIYNPRINSGDGETLWTFQTKRPSSDGVCTTGFVPIGAATISLATDDDPPDNGATLARYVIVANTAARFYLNYTDFSAAFVSIDQIIVRARVRLTDAGYTGTVAVRLGLASCDTVGQVTQLRSIKLGSTTGWIDIHAALPTADVISGSDAFNPGDDGYGSGGPWTLDVLNDPAGSRPQMFLQAVFPAAPVGAGNFEVDYIAVDLVGVKTETPASGGIVGVDRLYVTSHSFERLVDETFDTTGFENIRGTVALPTGESFDHAQLFGQIYLTNGVNQMYRYPAAGNVFEQFAAKPFGRTIASFANRILLGWTDDAGTTVPERVIYSALNDGNDYTAASAGFFDLLATPGGLVKLLQLSEDFCSAYKEEGVWIIRRTGDDSIPFIPDVIDAQTACLAFRTVKTTITPTGTPIQLFLGKNPVDNVSVFRFDGSTVTNVGRGLAKFLQDDANHTFLQYSFAAIEPTSGTYWLFIPVGSKVFPDKAWVLDIRTEEWTEVKLSHAQSAAGTWKLKTTTPPQPRGRETFILGRVLDGRPYKIDYTLATDMDQPGENAVPVVVPAYVLETGDLRLTEPQLQSLPYVFHLMYHDRGRVSVALDVSTDGGVTFNAALSVTLGTAGADGSLLYARLDDNVIQGRRIRFRLTFTAVAGVMSPIDIVEAWVEFETGGDNA